MANVDVIRSGKSSIEEWRENNPGTQLIVSDNSFLDLDLSNSDLSSAALLRCFFSDCNLDGANLAGATLNNSIFSGGTFRKADFSLAELTTVLFVGGDLTEVCFNEANLFLTRFYGADLIKATFLGANFDSTDLNTIDFTEADLSGAVFGQCSINRVDLSRCIGLGTIDHRFPSAVGIDTLRLTYQSGGNAWTPEVVSFLSGAGVAKEVLSALPAAWSEIKYHSCFIAYGEPDKNFGLRLYDSLTENGINCWMYSMDATPGERTQREIGIKRREAGKVIVLCSGEGLIRDGVLKEIEEQMDEDPDKLIPISLDNFWKQAGFQVVRGTRNLKPFLLERNYADFSIEANYESEFQKLLRGLEIKQD